MQVTIQKPQLKHAEEISHICSVGWLQTVEHFSNEQFKQDNIDYWYNIEKIQNDISDRAYTHVALIDSKVVGTIGGGMISDQAGEIFVFYMDPNYRYRGIGKKLLNALTEEQVIQGATEQWVSVQDQNPYGIPFYESRGFTPQRRKVVYTEGDNQLVSIRYWRSLQ